MQFNYEARTQEGDIQTGVIDSSDNKAAIDFLQRHNLIVVSVKAALNSDMPLFKKFIHFFAGGVKKKDLAIFSRQLAILI